MTMFLKNEPSFEEVETGDLRAVYLMAVSAFGQTHHVDRTVSRYLATSVFNAYISANFPASPLSMAQIEDMAVLSIQTMLDSHPGRFAIKQ